MQNIKLSLKCTNLSVSEETHKRIEQKIQSITKFIKPSVDSEYMFNVEVGKTTKGQNSGEIYRAEINLDVNGKFYRSESIKENLYQAIDDATDEMIALVRKNKEKRFSSFRRGASQLKNFFKNVY